MLYTFGFVDDDTFSYKGPNTDDDLESARSELFTVTRQVALLNCAPGGEVCYPGLPCLFLPPQPLYNECPVVCRCAQQSAKV